MLQKTSGRARCLSDTESWGIRIEGRQIGEEFVRRYLTEAGIDASQGRRTSATAMLIAGLRVEIKTASLGANGTFQFNHIRLDKPYHYLLCLGICPQTIVFDMWRKGAVAEEDAGHPVRMAEGQSVTWKLTKKLGDMKPIAELPAEIRAESSARIKPPKKTK